MAKRKKSPLNVPDLDILEQINLDAAGLDIGAEEIYACVPAGRDESTVRVFPTFTVDLHGLADWLAACRIETVAMESTGVYWIPTYEILEARGFAVYLVNARHIKNVPGRKTDILDCQWIQQLHTYGLWRASFRPPSVLIVEQGPRSMTLGARISDEIQERFFDYLDCPIGKLTGQDVPLPVSRKLEEAVLPSYGQITAQIARAGRHQL